MWIYWVRISRGWRPQGCMPNNEMVEENHNVLTRGFQI